MTEIVQPDWLKGFQPNTEPPAGNPNWKKGMPSPNKNGRPRGIVDKRTRVTQALMPLLTVACAPSMAMWCGTAS